jgi:hypothetical protein
MGAMAEMTEGLAGGLGVTTSPVAAQDRLVALAKRFLQRQLELVDGVIEEVTPKNALFGMGIDWQSAAEVLDRRDPLQELWGYDPVLVRWLEDMACRSLRYGNPTAWLQGAWVE